MIWWSGADGEGALVLVEKGVKIERRWGLFGGPRWGDCGCGRHHRLLAAVLLGVPIGHRFGGESGRGGGGRRCFHLDLPIGDRCFEPLQVSDRPIDNPERDFDRGLGGSQLLDERSELASRDVLSTAETLLCLSL